MKIEEENYQCYLALWYWHQVCSWVPVTNKDEASGTEKRTSKKLK